MEHFFSPNSGEDQKKGLHQKWNQARSQKFAMGGGLIFGSGGGASSRRRPMGAGSLGTEPPALENYPFFCKNNLILVILIKNYVFKT